jgi:hypothetical protein
MPPPGRVLRGQLGELGLVALLRLPLLPLPRLPLGDQAASRVTTHATPADIVEHDLAVELARQLLDGVPRRLHIDAAIAEPLGGQLGQRDQLGRVDLGGLSDGLGGLSNGAAEHLTAP